MSRRSLIPVLLLLAGAWPVAAQEGVPSSPPADSTAQPAPKKKKGMFGKLKSIAGNKTVQSVAKVAACTMVPGGQFVAAGIDAASAAGDKDAVGAASGAAGAATGSACYGGLAGAGAAGAGVGSVPGLAGVAASEAAAMTAMTAMSQMDAQPGTMASPGELSAKDEKKMRSMLKKQGMSDEQINSTIAMYKQQSQPEPEPAAEGSRFGGQQNQPPTVPGTSVAAAPVGLPEDYDAQVKAGRLVLIDLPWKGSTASLIAGTEEGVKATFVKIVESLSSAQGTWRVDVYVTEIDKGVAQSRASAIVLFLTNAGLPAQERLGGKAQAGTQSKQPRVEIVRN